MARRLVVGAAVLRDGLLLAARRTAPPEAAGRWELPGGKVEPGEPPAAALVRELVEELGVDVEVTGWLPGRVPVGDDLELAVATAVLVRGEPVAREHDLLRWVDAAGVAELDWLGPDRPFLPALTALLAADAARAPAPGARRAVLFEEEHARSVARRLVEDGFVARVERERLAGEDDDEDHPWAVLTDAPSFVVEVLVDEHDGWWEDDEPPATAVPVLPPSRVSPPPLPSAPKRVGRRGGSAGDGAAGGVGGAH